MNQITEVEKAGLERGKQFYKTGNAYMLTHANRSSTIGLALQSSPMALLAWIGEKFLSWSDPDCPLSLHIILESVSLYWLTDSIARCIYPYRQVGNAVICAFFEYCLWPQEGILTLVSKTTTQIADPDKPRPPLPFISKPMGYSSFAHELAKTPRAWVDLEGNVVFYRYHEKGGHFAALEQPEVLLADFEEFVVIAWKESS